MLLLYTLAVTGLNLQYMHSIIHLDEFITVCRSLIKMKSTVFWYVLPCSQDDVDHILTTRQYIREDSKLHTRRRQKLKSHTN
jgi:cytochrome oxidase assembly protein ShyY1